MTSKTSLAKLDIPVKTELPLDEDQKSRVAAMVAGIGSMDHRGGFVSQSDGEVRQLARIHFTCDATKAEEGSETGIDGVDGVRAPGPVHVLLEDTAGAMTGMKNARGEIGATWSYGVLFEVDGAVWFCGREQPHPEEINADEPILKRVSRVYSERPGAEVHDLLEALPIEGEFHISREDTPHVVSVPWLAGYAEPAEPGDDWPGRTEGRLSEQEILERMIARVRDLDADASPAL